MIRISIQARNLTNEKVFVGDEAGVYARLQKAAGQALGAVFEAQSINIALGDFKSTKLRCRGCWSTDVLQTQLCCGRSSVIGYCLQQSIL